MSENTNTEKVDSLKKELGSFIKQKDDIFADYMRLEGIIAYISNQLNTLDPNWNKPSEQTKEVKSTNKK
jgi:hypothetical protein